jgi:MFS family permease
LKWHADDPAIQNTAVYSTFAVFGFFGGTFVNKLGVKLTLSFGGIGYCIYAISLLVSVHDYVPGFNIFAGALLGVCAGLLWTAQGTIMISYPHEDQKGRYFAWFWAIFNMGAVIGSLVRNFFVSSNYSPISMYSTFLVSPWPNFFLINK